MRSNKQVSYLLTYDTFQTPIGSVTIVASDYGVKHLFLWSQDDRKTEKILIKYYPEAQIVHDQTKFSMVVRQLNEYFDKKRKEFTVPLDLQLTAFQDKVLNLVRHIPYGETRTYGQIAAQLGNGRAARAVGMANRNNPVPIIIPCHRVIGADGSLTGYAGKDGIETKAWLLTMESEAV